MNVWWKEETFWPSDLLPVDLRLIYSCDSVVLHYFDGPADKVGIFEHGRNLLRTICVEQDEGKLYG